MEKTKMGLAFSTLTLVFLMLFFSNAYCVQSHDNTSVQSKTEAMPQISQNVLHVDIWLLLSERYEFIDLDIRSDIIVEIPLNLIDPPATPYTIYAEIPFSLTKIDLPPGATYTYGFWGQPPVGVLTMNLPANTSISQIKLEGNMSGKSVFWRSSATTPQLNVTSPEFQSSSYRLILVPPSTSKILRVFSRINPGLSFEQTKTEGQRRIVVSSLLPIIILYQPVAWEIYAFLVMLLTILVVFVIPYSLKFRKFDAVKLRLAAMLRLRFLNKPTQTLKWFHQKLMRLDSSKLLTAYVSFCLLMISLSFVAGPDPRLKVYVFSSTEENSRIIGDFVRGNGGVTVSTLEEMGDLRTMTNIGVFSAAIIGDFYPPSGRQLNLKIFPALDDIRKIVVLEPFARDVFSTEIERRYPDKTIFAEDFNAFQIVLQRDINQRTNALGLNISPATYLGVTAFIGLCSFILVFVGLAFLASKLIETGKKPGFTGFPEAIGYSILYLTFTQVTYIVCSVLLTIPLGLHTTRLGSAVTAVSLLGFGGGGRPRMLAGIVGFLFGALISLKEGLKLERAGFISLLVVGFFIVIDPLTSGLIFYEFMLLYTVGPYFETAIATQSYIKTFLGEIGIALGGWASPTFGLSTGMILYYVGAVSFSLFSRLKQITATLMLFFCAFCVGSGGVRVADMNPWATVASLVPGVIAGFVFALFFSFISLAETFIRKKLGRGIL